MNREIKFRAWDKEKQCFVPQGEIVFKDYGDTSISVIPNDISYIGDSCHNGEPQRGRFIVTQFTGLTDKNGKEIYEDDIVRILYTDWPSNSDYSISLEDYKKSISHIGKVVWDNENASYCLNMYSKEYQEYAINSIHHGKHGQIEVIGNIYENPELLKHQ